MLTHVPSARLPIEQFRNDLVRVCGQFEARPSEGRATTRGAVQTGSHAGVEMAHVATDVQQIVRTRQNIRLDEGENYFLIIQEEGRALMAQNEQVRMISPGDMILVDSTRPSEFTFFGAYSRQLSLHLPRIEMRARFGDGIPGGLFLPSSDQTAVAICAVLSKVFSRGVDDAQGGFLREALFGLIGAMLHERGPGDRPAAIEADLSGAQVLKRGIAYMDSRFTDPDLAISSVADDLGVSLRQLQRSFALIGTTPTAYLLQKRMEHACSLLVARGSRRSALPISAIAMDCGFSDISYFNRLFRKAFGCAPGQYGRDGDAPTGGGRSA
ncbi:MAG: helix-turn-helix domain-containing protein [Dechloromonas sp.]|nr:helix-turn-helix domain-containing protein [Dechloromonas sp.]